MNGGTKNKTKQNKNIQTQNNNRKERTNDKNINYTCTVSALNSKKIAKKNYYIIYFYIWFVESVSKVCLTKHRASKATPDES